MGRVPAPRQATLASFRDATGEVIDQGIALFFPAPRSFTGEDVLELQGHGGPVVLADLLGCCLGLGARAARPGEFSERAFLNGRLDLAQAEAVADLVDAGSRAAARAAARSLEGGFSRQVDSLVEELGTLRLLVEAAIDFPEEDVDVLDQYDILGRLARALEDVSALRRHAVQGRLLREGATVVLVGEPNVGKSSLLNRLADEDVAMVSELPGTTRDVLRADLVLGGVPLHVVDTAGLRESADTLECMGIERGRNAARRADLVVVVVDARQPQLQALEALAPDLAPIPAPRLVVCNKADLATDTGDGKGLRVSALTGEGLEALRQALLRAVGWVDAAEGGSFIARARHLEAIARAGEHLEVATALPHGAVDLLAEELRYAEYAMAEITGRRTPDDLLGDIFRRFCIGK